MNWLKNLDLAATWQAVGPHALPILSALAVLIGGWIIARIIRRVIRSGLKRTSWDNRIASIVGLKEGEGGERVERTIANAVYYLLLGFVFVAFFQRLQIDAVTRPILTALDGIASAVPGLLRATLLALAAFIVATVVKKVLTKALAKTNLLARFEKLTGDESPEDRTSTAAQKVGTAAFWIILVIAAVPVFEALRIGGLATSITAAFKSVSVYLPRVIGAAVLGLVGYVLGRIARAVVAGAFDKLGADRALARVGFGKILGKQTVGGILGSVVMVFILLHFAISAVATLQIEAISAPLGLILTQIYGFLPKLLVGALILAFGVALARVASRLGRQALAAVGFNTLMVHIGLSKKLSPAAAAQQRSSKAAAGDAAAVEEILNAETKSSTPADHAGSVLGAVIVVLFLRQTLSTLGLEGLGAMLDTLIGYLPVVLVAVAVVGAGSWAGRWARERVEGLTASRNDAVTRHLGAITHVAILAVAAMIALQQLGVGTTIITIAFAAVTGAVALAFALAFGMGGREVAGEIVRAEYGRGHRVSERVSRLPAE